MNEIKENQQKTQTDLSKIQEVETTINSEVIGILADMQYHVEQLNIIDE